MNWRNWSGEVSCDPVHYHEPRTEEGIRDIVDRADPEGTIRVAGSGHSFSEVVPSDDTLVSLSSFTGVTDVDKGANQATVRAGTELRDLGETLADHGLAMRNMGDIDRQTIAGALATGTHGTGIDLGILSTQVVKLRLVTGDGQIRTLTPDDGDQFRAAQVSLGALGITTEVTLQLDPAYSLHEQTWVAPIDELLDDLERLRAENRNFEFFWFPHTDKALVKTLNKTDADPTRTVPYQLDERVENVLLEAICRLSVRFPSLSPRLARLFAQGLSGGEAIGPSREIYPTRRTVRFNETEYGVPADDGPRVVRDLRDHISRNEQTVLFPVEFRYARGDDILLSPAHGRDSAFLSVHAYHRKPHESFFEACQSIFREYGGRPHWGKMHPGDSDQLRSRYPEWDTFNEVRRAFDPDRLFLNEHLTQLFDPKTVPVTGTR